MEETWVLSLGCIRGSGSPLEKGMATHSGTLAWEIPWTEEPGRLQSLGSQKSQTWHSDSTTKQQQRIDTDEAGVPSIYLHLATPCSMQDLSSPKRNPTSDAVEVQSPHHWGTWEVWGVLFLRAGTEKAPRTGEACAGSWLQWGGGPHRFLWEGPEWTLSSKAPRRDFCCVWF